MLVTGSKVTKQAFAGVIRPVTRSYTRSSTLSWGHNNIDDDTEQPRTNMSELDVTKYVNYDNFTVDRNVPVGLIDKTMLYSLHNYDFEVNGPFLLHYEWTMIRQINVHVLALIIRKDPKSLKFLEQSMFDLIFEIIQKDFPEFFCESTLDAMYDVRMSGKIFNKYFKRVPLFSIRITNGSNHRLSDTEIITVIWNKQTFSDAHPNVAFVQRHHIIVKDTAYLIFERSQMKISVQHYSIAE